MKTSPPRAITLISIAAVSCRCGSRGSGSASTSRSNDGLTPGRRSPGAPSCARSSSASSGSSPALADGAWRSRSRAPGPCTTTVPAVSYPARPARPAIWWNSRALQLPHPLTVVLRERRDEHGADRHVDADAERVGAADDRAAARAGPASPPGAGSGAACPRGARRCPRARSRDSVLPNPVANRNPPIASAISSRCSRETSLTLDSACACSTAAAWVKCTT